MKLKHIAIGAALTLATSAVSAEEFYIDVGVDFDGGLNPNTAAGSTTTGWLSELLYNYQSTTVADCGALSLSTGCNINTFGGVNFSGSVNDAIASLGLNGISDLSPQDTLNQAGPSDNNYSQDWGLTFQFDLSGTISGSELITDYDSGAITFYYYDSFEATIADTFTELFTIDVYDTINTPAGGQNLAGVLSSVGTGTVNGVMVGDMFNFATGSFNDLITSFVNVVASVDYNTDASQVQIDDNGDGTSTLRGLHDGSISFAAVPEPSTIAIMSLGLLGLVSTSRRRRK
ncbi:MAG: PEP-CTERM sorting domain-containing protein [Gammaproteobacteria bacterium]|nr:PEP-CTERM sorting domain-containing protein [Gammaproteobacteria bacterium]|tara:strand:- start:2395 stop:3258 length:864 start_codon:yes stop_codon:yes gene_type:complete